VSLQLGRDAKLDEGTASRVFELLALASSRHTARVLISPTLYAIALYGGVIVAAAAIVTFYLRDGRKEREASIPPATIAGRRWKPLLYRYAPWLGLLAGAGTSFAMYTQGRALVVVRDTPDGVVGEREIYLGHDLPYDVHENGDPGSRPSHPTWVVNHTSRGVRLKTVWYGNTSSWMTTSPDNRGDLVLPGTAQAVESVDFIGVDPPPAEVTAAHDEHVATRTWVTW
jgi:hypothetical protein